MLTGSCHSQLKPATYMGLILLTLAKDYGTQEWKPVSDPVYYGSSFIRCHLLCGECMLKHFRIKASDWPLNSSNKTDHTPEQVFIYEKRYKKMVSSLMYDLVLGHLDLFKKCGMHWQLNRERDRKLAFFIALLGNTRRR